GRDARGVPPVWNKLTGVSTKVTTLTIDPEQCFFRYDNPTWLVCDWEQVRSDLLDARENEHAAMEQIALDYVNSNSRITHDPAEVLTTAWHAYAYLFHPEHLEASDLPSDVSAEHLRMLIEVTTMMALNRVEQSGEITNVGPAWMFTEAVKVVYGIDGAEAELVDELYQRHLVQRVAPDREDQSPRSPGRTARVRVPIQHLQGHGRWLSRALRHRHRTLP